VPIGFIEAIEDRRPTSSHCRSQGCHRSRWRRTSGPARVRDSLVGWARGERCRSRSKGRGPVRGEAQLASASSPGVEPPSIDVAASPESELPDSGKLASASSPPPLPPALPAISSASRPRPFHRFPRCPHFLRSRPRPFHPPVPALPALPPVAAPPVPVVRRAPGHSSDRGPRPFHRSPRCPHFPSGRGPARSISPPRCRHFLRLRPPPVPVVAVLPALPSGRGPARSIGPRAPSRVPARGRSAVLSAGGRTTTFSSRFQSFLRSLMLGQFPGVAAATRLLADRHIQPASGMARTEATKRRAMTEGIVFIRQHKAGTSAEEARNDCIAFAVT